MKIKTESCDLIQNENYIVNAYGVLYRCPMGNRNIDCPINEIEHYSFRDRVRWFDELDADKRNQLLKHHFKCIKKREEEL